MVFVAWRVRSSWVRLGLVCGVVLWAGFLLYFHMEGLARITSGHPGNTAGFSSLFVAGISAYKDALMETRVALFLSLCALAILSIWHK